MTGTARELIDRLLEVMQNAPDKLWDITEHREKRTLTQNAYYWALLGKTARSLNMTTTELHNRMLRDCSDLIAETYGGKKAFLLLPDTEETEKKALASETVHIKPTAQTKVLADGITYRTYVLLKGSHDMAVDEFSALLDNLIGEAKQIGIETLTPAQLAVMRRAEKEAEYAQKHHAKPRR